MLPGVFGGNFETSYQPLFGRFPFILGSTAFQLPGWSFQGGTGVTGLLGATGRDQGLALSYQPGTVLDRVMSRLSAESKGVIQELAAITTGIVTYFSENLAELAVESLWNIGEEAVMELARETVVHFIETADIFANAANYPRVRAAIAELASINEMGLWTSLGKIGKILGNTAFDISIGIAGDLITSLLDLMDASFKLSQSGHGLSSLTHNRMYFPPTASQLTFDYRADDPVTVEVWMRTSENGVLGDLVSHTYTLSGDGTLSVDIPSELIGHAGLFGVRIASPFNPNPVLLDNFRLDGAATSGVTVSLEPTSTQEGRAVTLHVRSDEALSGTTGQMQINWATARPCRSSISARARTARTNSHTFTRMTFRTALQATPTR